MYKVAICDDKSIVRDELCSLCADVLDFKGIEYNIIPFCDAESLEYAIDTHDDFDLIILDIELTGKNGMELAKDLRKNNNMVSIIFVSSHETYLKDGYSIQPIHFLIKPVTFKMLYDAISADLRINHSTSQIVLNFKNKFYTINTSDITYIEVMGHNLYIHTVVDKTVFRQTMAEIERMLPKEFFCRCHNSYIVNLKYIDEFSRTEISLNNGVILPIGRKYSNEFQKKFIRYMNSFG